ncbi:probable maltase isoform X2 [Bemisia tabaci]|uniref:probable maltase isoform X2 n=1 Tax=Bemisia tabaci TaxID=7038 RepID=UPI003B27F78F
MRTIITSENFAAVWMVVIFVYRFQMLEAREKDWYRTASMYQVYTRSFKDTNGDGVGDIKGVHEKLDYIQKVGFDTIWIQTLFKSPMKDMGYDISDFMAVDPLFGTMEELKKLIDDIHTRGMKVIVDFVPNHTSDESEWFEKSINKIEPYTDFYVWANPNGSDPETQLPLPPNNWLSVFGDSMWEWNEKRQQFYLHQFSISQPDLNYRNPKVKDAMKNVLRFWLDFGVDGFRVDAIAHLVEDALLRDNPWRSPEKTGKRDFYDQIPKYSSLQEETYQVTHEWRSMLDEYEDKGLGVRIMTFEMYDDLDVTRKFFGNETYKIMHFPLNVRTFLPMHMKNATDTSDTIRDYIELMPSVGVPSWIMSNHDISRMATRSFPEFSVPGFMIALLLPGVVSIYYGEEICMQQMLLRKDQLRDASKKIEKLNPGHSLRDPCRTPMQWDDSPNAGTNSPSANPVACSRTVLNCVLSQEWC